MPPASREPNELADQVDASIRTRDEKELAELREAIRPSLSELVLLPVLFAFSLGVVFVIIFGLPRAHEGLYQLNLLWSLGFVFSVVMCLDFLIRRLRVLRRLAESQQRELDRLRKRDPRA